MNIAGVRAAGNYLRKFIRSKSEDFQEYMRQAHPNAGYGRYPGHDSIANVMRSICHYLHDHFESVDIPGDYASPEHLYNEIKTCSAFVEREQQNFDQAAQRARTALKGSLPENAAMVERALRECRYAVDYALTLCDGAGAAPLTSSTNAKTQLTSPNQNGTGLSTDTTQDHIVVLVHGIRDYALWQNAIGDVLYANGLKVDLTNYGRFDLLRFLIPIEFFRKKAAGKILNQIRIVKEHNKSARISVIAHSFGTYIVSYIMRQNFDVKFHRVIFCGSVVRYDFPFEQVSNRFDAPILNEVGTRDIWPAMAESITTGYGSAGSYGFRRPLVRDRWHNKAGHGYFLNADFCTKFWVPYLADGTIVPGHANAEKPRWRILLLSILKLKVVVPGILAGLAYIFLT